MELGIGYFPTHDGMPPAALARMLEERGHESLFVAEHTHIPVDPDGPKDPGGNPRWVPSAARGPIEAALEQWESVVSQLHGES